MQEKPLQSAPIRGYLDGLKVVHPERHGNANSVAHCSRRVFTLTRQSNTLRLIATNTIAQRNTHNTG